MRVRRGYGCAVVAGAAALAAAAVRLAVPWPDVAALAHRPPRTTAFIERDRGRGVAVDWRPVPMERISCDLAAAVLAGEDMGFFSHRGFDLHEVAEALREALRGRRLRGASTVSQQLARNLWLGPERTLTRKLREAVLTVRLERTLGKCRILELYLDVAQFGPGVYGAEAAARRYFGVSAAGLDAAQAAALAAALPAPARRYPGAGSRAARRAAARIAARVRRAAWLRRLVAGCGCADGAAVRRGRPAGR